jgi:hypothetical protein
MTPSGVYPRKPKPPDPFKLAKGKTIKKMEGGVYRTSIVLTLDNDDRLVFSGFTESAMFSERWAAVSAKYYTKEQWPEVQDNYLGRYS